MIKAEIFALMLTFFSFPALIAQAQDTRRENASSGTAADSVATDFLPSEGITDYLPAFGHDAAIASVPWRVYPDLSRNLFPSSWQVPFLSPLQIQSYGSFSMYNGAGYGRYGFIPVAGRLNVFMGVNDIGFLNFASVHSLYISGSIGLAENLSFNAGLLATRQFAGYTGNYTGTGAMTSIIYNGTGDMDFMIWGSYMPQPFIPYAPLPGQQPHVISVGASASFRINENLKIGISAEVGGYAGP